MKRLIEFATQDGDSVVVEVEEEPSPGTVRAARPGEIAEHAVRTFEDALGPVRIVAKALISQLRDFDEVKVEFGVTMKAEAGALIASTSGQANFTVTLTWKSAEAN
jgi:SOS-response transcriptional repressor LexA